MIRAYCPWAGARAYGEVTEACIGCGAAEEGGIRRIEGGGMTKHRHQLNQHRCFFVGISREVSSSLRLRLEGCWDTGGTKTMEVGAAVAGDAVKGIRVLRRGAVSTALAICC
ncbi:hypothetical protein B0H13DRAFT_1886001 [Mycena leptocephala]|nr:hypothetical protein B0H13DRAFT_1886001 [Mycena leptocephala]